jgi:hypothetical protein
MGVDKNSSWTINSAYALNSQPRIPTRACQSRVVTTDLPTLRTSLKQTPSESATQEEKDLGKLQCPGWTVCSDWADGPWGSDRQSAGPQRMVRKTARTTSMQWQNTDGPYPTRGRSVGNSYRADCPRQAGELSANHMQPKATVSTARTMNMHEQTMN